MTAPEFASTIITLATRWRFSVTSWGRSVARNAAVGGVANSYHLQFLAVDVVLDDAKEQAAFIADCNRARLWTLNEGDHIHLQPEK